MLYKGSALKIVGNNIKEGPISQKEMKKYEEAGKEFAKAIWDGFEKAGIFEGPCFKHERPGVLEQIRLELQFRSAIATDSVWSRRAKDIKDEMGGAYYPSVRKQFNNRCVLCNKKVRNGHAWYYGIDNKCALLCEKCVLVDESRNKTTIVPMPEEKLQVFSPTKEELPREGIGNPAPPHGTKERMSHLLGKLRK